MVGGRLHPKPQLIAARFPGLQPGKPRLVSDSDPKCSLALLWSLPQIKYLTTQTTELTPHPSDPAALGSRSVIQERIEAERG